MCQRPKPSALAETFTRVPETADLVVKHLDPRETESLMKKIEPALYFFSKTSGGGLDRLMRISREGKWKRRALRRLPDLPRLLQEDWQKILEGKRLVIEKAEDDDTVRFFSDFIQIRLGGLLTRYKTCDCRS